ncbi:MAG TPA: acyl carrier protein [Mycobacteriales bacterium]|nr:acyl carrier protein [Mycobacteriales bacterium]
MATTATPAPADPVPQLTRDGVRARLAALLVAACDGEVTVAEVTAWTGTLAGLGAGSLAQLRLVDALEREYRVQLDLDGAAAALSTVDALADHLAVLLRLPGAPA